MAQQVKSTLQEDSRKFLHQPRQTGLMEEHLRTLLRGCPFVTGEEPGPGNGRKFVKEEMALGGKGCSQLQGRRGSLSNRYGEQPAAPGSETVGSFQVLEAMLTRIF